jgi:formate dehydrogenase alpha subunit
MIGRGAMSNSIAELEDAPLIFAAGTNTTESHPVIALKVKKAVAKGAKLIVVDPRKIELVSFAHRWLRLKVGTDIPLYNAMAHVMIEEGLYDGEYVAARTEGLEEMREFLKSYTPAYAEEITGVPREEIVAAAREYAGAERAAIIYTLGITEHSCGVHNVQSLANLALLCGNFGIPNAGVNPLRGQNNVQGAGDVGCMPDYLPGYQRTGKDEARQAWEKAWAVKLNSHPGITKITALDEILKGSIRAVYIMGENTAVSDANVGKTRRALQAVEFLVVQDIFLTETAQMAHVVLPAASFAETDGTFTNTERRVQRVRKAVEPPGQARPDWTILCELATRLGYPMSYDHPSQIWDELARNTPILAGINYDRIELQGIQWPCPTPEHPGTPYLHKENFVTEKGYFQMVPHVPIAEPPNEQYPLILTTGRRRATYHTGTQTGRAAGFDLLVPHESLEVSPEDAAELKLSEDEEVEVVSRRGRVRAPVKITERSPRGVVFMSFHFPGKTLTNLLTTDVYDPVTETPELKACAVRVEKLDAARTPSAHRSNRL